MHAGFDGERIEADWALDRNVWGRGYAFEAASAIFQHGFQTRKFERVWGVARIENRASIGLMQKLGMRFVEERAVDGFDSSVYCVSAGEFVHLDR